ncbi:hypothetical protein GCM10009584_19980 [Ornithinimicrobium humiphilum]
MRPGQTTLTAIGLAALLTTGCADGPRTDDQSDPDRDSPVHTASAQEPSDNTADQPTPQPDATFGEEMQIQITIADQTFTATLADSPAADDLLTQLPVTVEMVDHGGVEKTGPLRSALSLDGQPEGADPEVGDLGYYAPGNDLVLYYGDQSYFPGIVILGQLDGDAPERIASLSGAVTATVEAGTGR